MKYVNLDCIGKIAVRDIRLTDKYVWCESVPSTTRKTWWGGTRKTKALPEGWVYSWGVKEMKNRRYTDEQVLKNTNNHCILNKKLYQKPYIEIVYANDMSSDYKYFDDLQQAKDMSIALMNNSGRKFELIFE